MSSSRHSSYLTHGANRLNPSAFDRIADRLAAHGFNAGFSLDASKADVDKLKSRKDAEERALHTPYLEKDPEEDNQRVRIRVGSVREIDASKYRHVGSGLYRSAHALWELRTAEDDGGGYVLVRKAEERAVDHRDNAPMDTLVAGGPSERSAMVYRATIHDVTPPFETGDVVLYPRHGKIAQAVVILMMPGDGSAMVQPSIGGDPEEVGVDELTGTGENVEADDSWMSPGHPELADLGPMDSGDGSIGHLGEQDGVGGEGVGEQHEGEDHSSVGAPADIEVSPSSKEAGGEEHSAESSHDDDSTRLSNTALWSRASLASPANRNSGMVRLAVDYYDHSDDLSEADKYMNLPGGIGETVGGYTDEEPTRARPQSHTRPINYGEHTSQPGDRAPVGAPLPNEELNRIYQHMAPNARPQWRGNTPGAGSHAGPGSNWNVSKPGLGTGEPSMAPTMSGVSPGAQTRTEAPSQQERTVPGRRPR